MKLKKQRPHLIFLAAALLGCFPVFSKEKEEIPIPPPLAKTGTMTVHTDQAAEIPLQIAGRIAEPLTFLIRKEPKHGKLSALRRTGRNSASVLYTPDSPTNPGDDFFSFAAQSVDSPVSAPATVWIRLVEKAPVLEHSQEIDFGKVFLGEKEERPLKIKNTGGGVAAGTIRPNLPWHTGKAEEYRVPAGTEATVPLFFEPLEEREFSDRIPIGSDPKSAVLVRGSGVAPISWPKDGLVVSPGNRGEGTLSITFTNNSPVERILAVKWPEFFKAPGEVTLPANAPSVVKLDIAAPLSLNYEGEAEIRSGNFSGRLPIRAFPAPAKLSVRPERGLKLGATENGHTLKGRILVRNTGGSNASLQVIAPPGFLILPDPSGLILGGGDEQAFEIQAERPKSGSFNKTIRIQSPACDAVEISIEAPPATKAHAAVPVENFLDLPSEPPETTPEKAPPSGKVPPVETVNLLASENHAVEIGWQLASPKISGFKIERRQISAGNEGRVLVDWVPWPEAKITISERAAVARFERLPSNAFWTIRIIALDESGHPFPPSPAFQIATQPSKQIRIPWWLWMFALAALAAAAFQFLKKYQSGLRAKEDERIARLERK
ncbi:MAG: hypothetical protein WC076_07600 [Terrimicrobiaceae bacterium]